MKLVLVRHGETDYNSKKLIQGSLNCMLNKVGIEQAKKVSLRLKEELIDVVYVSDLKRAVLTAKEILNYHPNIKVIYTPLLREKNYGIFEGKPVDEILEARKKSRMSYFEFKPKGGESCTDILARINKVLNDALEKYPEDNVLFVTHGGLIKFLLLHLFGEEFEFELPYHNCAVSILEVHKNKLPQVKLLNDVEHLP